MLMQIFRQSKKYHPYQPRRRCEWFKLLVQIHFDRCEFFVQNMDSDSRGAPEYCWSDDYYHHAGLIRRQPKHQRCNWHDRWATKVFSIKKGGRVDRSESSYWELRHSTAKAIPNSGTSECGETVSVLMQPRSTVILIFIYLLNLSIIVYVVATNVVASTTATILSTSSSNGSVNSTSQVTTGGNTNQTIIFTTTMQASTTTTSIHGKINQWGWVENESSFKISETKIRFSFEKTKLLRIDPKLHRLHIEFRGIRFECE